MGYSKRVGTLAAAGEVASLWPVAAWPGPTDREQDKAVLVSLIKGLWQALGTGDAEGTVGRMVFPFKAMEVSESPGAQTDVFLFATADELREELAPEEPEDAWLRARLYDFHIASLRGDIAVVAYRATLPEDELGGVFELFVVAERGQDGSWRIRVASIPM
ncbi:MAG: hypothetical protein N2512_03980 [Armatimonadetes bacterium]|nr:hypothetical protein [Armatimonadota bacterium]